MLQKLAVNGFIWVENKSQFNRDFIKSYCEENDDRYFLEVDVQYPETLRDLRSALPFLPKRIKACNNLDDK